jgi:hypothetical protein
MTVLVSDSFNRADNTTLGNTETGQTWKYFSGTFGISGNQALAKTATIHNNAFVDVGSGDYRISATFSGANFTGLVFKRNSNPATNDFYVLRINSSVLQLYRNSGGSFTSLSSVSSTNNVGDILSVECIGTTIKFYQNGVLKGTVTDATLTANTGYGLYSSNNTTSSFDDFQIEDLGTGGGSVLTLSLSDSITLSESFAEVRSGKLTLTDSINAIDSISIKSTRFLSLVDSITTSESLTKRRQSYLSLADGLTIGDTKTSTRATINTLVRALSDSINITDSISIRAMRYLTIFDLFSIVDSIGTTGGGNVAQTIKFKRGNEVDLPTLAEGEPAITMDTNKMFVGTPNGNRQIATLLVVDSVANLPIADKSKQFLISGVLGGTGTADALYVCKKLSNDTYDWVQFV